MKKKLYILTVSLVILLGCTSKKVPVQKTILDYSIDNYEIETQNKSFKDKKDTVRIANDSLQYEVIIIDAGFSSWLNSVSFARGYHSQSFLENKNNLYINEWNSRVFQPQRYNPNLYEMVIDYDRRINYGYEVNYLIYNYMIYFQNTFKQNLFGNVPPR